MAGNTAVLEFAGDASKLQRAGKQGEAAVEGVGAAATSASQDLNRASAASAEYTDRAGKLGAAVSGATDAFDSAGAAVQAMADIQSHGIERAQRLARAANDVRQAQEDQAQATRDLAQASIDADQAAVDLEQAQLDQATALKEYNAAVKEHGANSDEARQAQIDLKQAGVDVKQAQEDAAQATRDASQASIDAEAATLDLAEAQREAKPPELQTWADNINMVTPILSGLVGVVGLVTAAQWAWNIAQLASPTTWIILAIVALIGVIVLIATKTDWFQKAWKWAWGGIKDAAAAVGRFFRDTVYEKWILGAWNGIKRAGERVWDWLKALPGKIKSAFASIATFISAPYRAAFNLIASAWNNTVGRLSFTFPGWIPGIGGNTISVPNLPHFHSGGTVPGAPGSEMLAVLQAGERVTPASSSAGNSAEGWVRLDLGSLGDALLDAIAPAVQRRGGRVTALGVAIVGGQVRT